MATPLPVAALRDVALDDKYALESGRVYLTGIQALVRLLILQQQRDKLAGLNTGGFVSGAFGGRFDRVGIWTADPWRFCALRHCALAPRRSCCCWL